MVQCRATTWQFLHFSTVVKFDLCPFAIPDETIIILNNVQPLPYPFVNSSKTTFRCVKEIEMHYHFVCVMIMTIDMWWALICCYKDINGHQYHNYNLIKQSMDCISLNGFSCSVNMLVKHTSFWLLRHTAMWKLHWAQIFTYCWRQNCESWHVPTTSSKLFQWWRGKLSKWLWTTG